MKNFVRQNLVLAIGNLIAFVAALIVSVEAYGMRKVLTVLTGLVLIVGIVILARDMDRRIVQEDRDADA